MLKHLHLTLWETAGYTIRCLQRWQLFGTPERLAFFGLLLSIHTLACMSSALQTSPCRTVLSYHGQLPALRAINQW